MAKAEVQSKHAGEVNPATESTTKTDSKNDAIPVLASEGVMVRLHSTGKVTLEVVPDAHYENVHPNCHAPADLLNVRLLMGGGSGTAVFGADHPDMKSVVMKHGGHGDTQEVFSLVKISEELVRRGESSRDAASFMQRRVPEFSMVYVSSYHVRDRSMELWNIMKRACKRHRTTDLSNMFVNSLVQRASRMLSENTLFDVLKMSEEESDTENNDEEVVKRKTRSFYVGKGDDNDIAFRIDHTEVTLFVPELEEDGSMSGGTRFLEALSECLICGQKNNRWKFTLGQKKIGGPTSHNASSLLTSGRLVGRVREKLIDEFTQILKALQAITLPEEKGGLSLVREELVRLRQNHDPAAVSDHTNSFVGSCIFKNYHPLAGRLPKLRKFGYRFGDENFIYRLLEEERIPCRLLGKLLVRGARFAEVFEGGDLPSALDAFEDKWLDIIELAASFDDFPAATDCVWNCGLTDAGLQNCFLCESRGIELFDLGEPGRVSLPAFLAKFLMSFFHGFGMEDDGDKWVVRFGYANGKLAVRDETKAMFPYLYEAFTEVLNNLVENVFDGNQRVRSLLLHYTVLQLLSDASFCLGRWEDKGGGGKIRERGGLEKWLWRVLWDIYIASHVYDALMVQNEK